MFLFTAGFFLFLGWRFNRLFYNFQFLFQHGPREKFLRTAITFSLASGINGDYLEFGSFQGHSLIRTYHFMRNASQEVFNSMRFYVFDSFQGLPEIKGVDLVPYNKFYKGQYSLDLESFLKNLKKRKIDLEKIIITPGWYKDTLNNETKKKLPIKKASLIFIDCDLYESTVPVLNFITDYLQDGTIVAFDDWYCFRANPNKGQIRAFREWSERNPNIIATEYYKFDWHGNSFIINFVA